jgi:AcrR family transcriptional regulator
MGKQERGRQTVQRVLDAALVCFTSRGLYEATIHELADEAKVSIGSLYHHFGSRDRVAFALYCRCVELLWVTVAGSVVNQREARTGVQSLVRAYLGWVSQNRDAARFIYAAGQSELIAKWRDELDVFDQRLLRPILEWLAVHARSRSLVPMRPALFEVVVIGPIAEFARRWLFGVPGLDLDEALQVLPETVWRAVAQGS